MFQQSGELPSQLPDYDYGYDPGPFGLWWLFGPCWGLVSLVGLGITLWMLIECIRKDPDRYVWMWIILLVFPPLGGLIYFFARWLPESRLRLPAGLRRLFRGRELEQLRAAALRIGNPHQYIQWGDALRETRDFDQAAHAYGKALEKDPKSAQALWGAALVDREQKLFPSAHDRLARVLEIDPQYKFGDVSLEFGKVLQQLGRNDDAIAHLQGHVKRWPQAEALYLLAALEAERGNSQAARGHLQALLLDLSTSPKSIARKQTAWGSRAKKLLRKLPS